MLKALGRDVALYGAGEFVFKFVAFAVFPIYAHVLSVAEFGIWALIAASTLLLGYLVNFGVNQAVQRYYFDQATERFHEPRIISTALAQLLLSALVLVGAAMLAAIFFADPLDQRYGIDRLVLLIALAAVVPDQLLQFCLDVLRLHFSPIKFLALSFAKNIVGTALALYFLLVLDAGLVGLFGGLLIGSLAAVPIGLWLIRRDLTLNIDPVVARSLFAFGFPLVFTSVAHWIYTSLDRWMLIEMATPQELGLYSIAAKYATIVTFLISGFGQAWIPFAIRLSRDDPAHRVFYARILSLWYFLLALGGLGIALYAREALIILTPRSYWSAASILPLLAAGLVLYGTTLVTGLGIAISKRTIFSMYGTWLAALLNFALNLVLIPAFGAVGTAAATFVSYAVLTGFLLACSQRLHPIPLEMPKLIYCTLLTIGTAALSVVDLGAANVTAMLIKVGILLFAVAGAFWIGILDRSFIQMIRRKGAV